MHARPAQEDCTVCGQTVYNPVWESVGFRDPHTNRFDRWYRTIWECPETGEGYTVFCHNCVLTRTLAEAEQELREAREYHTIRRTAALNAWAYGDQRQVELAEQFREWVADELARQRQDEHELELRRQRRAVRDAQPVLAAPPPAYAGWGPPPAAAGRPAPEVVALQDAQGQVVGVKAPPPYPPAPNHA